MKLLVVCILFFFFKQKTAYDIGLGIPAEPLSDLKCDSYLNQSLTNVPSILSHFSSSNASVFDRIPPSPPTPPPPPPPPPRPPRPPSPTSRPPPTSLSFATNPPYFLLHHATSSPPP